MPGIHPTEPFSDCAGKVSLGASGRVPAAKAERPLSVQSTDLRGDVGQRARRADSGRSLDDDGSAGFGPKRKFDLTPLGARTGFAAAHSITSPARERIDDGIVRPNALAVLRLITRSNVVGCSTGMSAGLAPRKILTS